ncbi:MAG TPA: cupin domain-containing protein [Pseudolabrys sp.]|nr:cupin domain-containing protein [Pseudolabrys sp.]
MAIQRLSTRNVTVLKNSGKLSEQLVWPRNAPASSLTVTRVTMAPGAVSSRHSHAHAEQIWIVEAGEGALLLAGGQETPLAVGDIVRTPAGDIHGVANTGEEPLVYLAITTPPEDFTGRYEEAVEAPTPDA